MTLVTCAPFNPTVAFVRQDIYLWHVQLPGGGSGHFFTFAVVSPVARPAVPARDANPFETPYEPQIVRVWRNVTDGFERRARRYGRRRLCPTCSPGAASRCEPRYTDLP